jgi:phage gpG-like protein
MGLVAVKLKFPDLLGAFRSQAPALAQFIAAQIQTNRALLFDSEGSYHGHPRWAPLKFRNGQPLKDTGVLKNSIGPRTSGGKPARNIGSILQYRGSMANPVVTVGTNLYYAELQNKGGVVQAGPGKALAIPLPMGKNATQAAKAAGKARGYRVKHSLAKIAELEKHYKKNPSRLLRQKIDKIKKFVENKPQNQHILFLKKVKIPARNFDGWNGQDQKNLEITLKNKIEQILNSARSK